MNLYKQPTHSRRDPLGMLEAVTHQGPAIAQATLCRGYLFDDIGISASNSSGAAGGDSTTGDFIVNGAKNASAAAGKSSAVWILLLLGVVALLLVWKKLR